MKQHPGLLAILACLALPAPAHAQLGDPAAVPPPATHADPYVPPAKRLPSQDTPASGAALRGQALQKLQQRFAQADLDGDGRLTLAEAQKAGLGFVVQHFDQIDSAHRGAVSFDDLKAFFAQRRKDASAR